MIWKYRNISDFLGWQDLATLLGNWAVRGWSCGAVKDRQRIVRVVSGGIHIQSVFKMKLVRKIGKRRRGRKRKKKCTIITTLTLTRTIYYTLHSVPVSE